MTSLHLKTNKEETFLTFLLVSGFPQQHWQIYPRSWLWVISPVLVLYTWESCRKRGHAEPMCVSDEPLCCPSLSIHHSSASHFKKACVQLSPVSTWCQPPVWTQVYHAVQVFAVAVCLWGYAEKGTDLLRVATAFSPSVLQYSPIMIPLTDPPCDRSLLFLWRILQSLGLAQASCKDKQGVQLMFFSTSLINSSPT